MNEKASKIIHIGWAAPSQYLFLQEMKEGGFGWFNDKGELLGISLPHVIQAIQYARKKWKENGFRTLRCGTLYTLPERDEHGENALFCQMVKAYSTPNGVYFDPELGHSCVIHNASQEALSLMNSLKKRGSL